ncbi:MAG: hypothetical protein FWG92_06305 [Leptospirales bacterium]|nr:hypothetical protein [Leptospirales bacterium]
MIPRHSALKLAFLIIDWAKQKPVQQVFEEEDISLYFFTKASGTANSEILHLLGIGASDKALILCLEKSETIPLLLKKIRKKIGYQNAGAGIAFTVPLSGINNPVLQLFKEDAHEYKTSQQSKKEAPKMGIETTHDLIVSILNQGYSDDFMNTAREAGAGGGTVFNARSIAAKAVKLFGISIQDEKEIIIILTKQEKRASIMQAISSSFGLTSKAQGVIFSLPVDQVVGMNISLEE